MQVVLNSISNLLASQSGIRVIGPLFYLFIIVIDTEFVLYSIDQEVYSQGRIISEQGFVYY